MSATHGRQYQYDIVPQKTEGSGAEREALSVICPGSQGCYETHCRVPQGESCHLERTDSASIMSLCRSQNKSPRALTAVPAPCVTMGTGIAADA